MLTFDKNYNFKKDPYVKDYFYENKDLRIDTVKSYENSLKQLSEANKETIKNIIDNCLKQQKSRIDEDMGITEFNPNHPDSLIKQYINNFREYCIEKGNMNTSINDKTDNIIVFFNHFKVKLPKIKKLENDRKKWNKLSKEDVRYILKYCNIVEQGLITFTLSTGLRRWDISELTIGDFMEATQKMGYHNFVEIDDFIDNAPDDMIGFWDLIPHKESKNEIPCKTFNSPESSNLIMQNLRRIKNEYMPKKSKKEKTEIKLEKGDALFGSSKKCYKGTLTKESMTNAIRAKNPRFKEWKIKQIDENIKNKKISKEDREKEIEKIPEVNPHALRKFFTNAVDTYGGLSLRANLVMEGHSSKVPTDTHYLQKQKEELFLGYKRILPHLTIMEDIEVRLLTNEEGEELNNKVAILEGEKKSLEKKIETLEKEKDKEIKELKAELENNKVNEEEIIKQVEKKFETLRNELKHTERTTPIDIEIKQSIDLYMLNLIDPQMYMDEEMTKFEKQIRELDPLEILTVKEIAYDLAINDINFEHDNKGIEKAMKKAIVKMKANPDLKLKAKLYHDEQKKSIEKMELISQILNETMNELDMWEDEEIEELKSSILSYSLENIDKILLKDINKDFIMKLIEKQM